MVELALLLPVLLFLAMIMVDFGRSLATGVAASNTAKQAEFVAAQTALKYNTGGYTVPLPCLQDQAQALVSSEVSGTVSLTNTIPSRTVMAGETGIQATVAVSFTPLTPLMQSVFKTVAIRQSASDEVLPSASYATSVTPTLPVTAVVQQQADPTVTTTVHYVDTITWAVTAPQVASTTTYYNADGTGPYTATGYYQIFRSPLPHVGSPTSACPLATVSMNQGTTMAGNVVYQYAADVPDASTLAPTDVYSPTYWIQAIGPAPPGYAGAAAGLTMVTRQ